MPPYDYSSVFNNFGMGTPQAYGMMAQQPAAPMGYEMPSFSGMKQLSNPGTAGPSGTDWFGKDGRLGTIFGGVQALGGLYMGLQQLSQAKDALNFQKKAYGTNLANSVKTYNTSLEDRINGRTSDYAGKQQDVQAYLDSHKLKV